MLTIKEYSKSRGRSYENTRLLLKKYAEELDEHIIVQNRTRLLDDYAVEFLDGKRRYETTTVVAHDQDDLDRIKELEEKNQLLEDKLKEMALSLLDYNNLLKEQNKWIEDKSVLEKDNIRKEFLLEQKDSKLQEADQKIDELKKHNDALQKESDEKVKELTDQLDQEKKRYKRTWFGFYKRSNHV